MTRGREVLVGAVIIAGILVAVLGTLWLKGANWGRPTRPVEALFTDAAQLAEGNSVKFRGVSIGSVEAIAVEPSGVAVRVIMQVREGVRLPDDAVVLLAPESMFGSWQAEIVSRADYPRFDFFPVPEAEVARGVLGGYALPEFSRLTASAQEISDNLAGLTSRLEVAFNDSTAADIRSAIDNIEAISSELRRFVDQQSDVARSVTASADSALMEIEEASRVARRSFQRIEGLLGDPQIDTIITNTRIASGDIQRIAADLSGSTDDLSRTLRRADSVFTRIDRLSARIEAGEGTLGRLMVDTTFAARAEDVLGQLDLLLKDLRENPRRYVRLSIF